MDDEPSVRLLLKRWIERSLQAEVREAGDGLQALEIIAENELDLMILDINMPVLNGIDMLSLLHSDPRRTQIEVIVASQVSGSDQVRSAIELGVSDYLLKPLQYDGVIQRLKGASQRVIERRVRGDSRDGDVRTRFLCIDADPNFCAFVESALAGDCAVQTARTVAEGLVKALRWKPDALLVSPKLEGLKLDFLVERLKSASPDRDPTVAAVDDFADDEEVPPQIAGVVPRTFVPETFRSHILRLLCGGAAPAHGLSAWRDFLEAELNTALRQALGMMTGVEPEEIDATEGPFDVFGAIHVDADDGSFLMRVETHCRKEYMAALMSAMLGEDFPVEDGELPPADALNEILNVIAGRVKNSCLERKIAVSLGLPTTGASDDGEMTNAVLDIVRYCRWKGEHEFRLRLRARPAGPRE